MLPTSPADQIALAEQLVADSIAKARVTGPADPRYLAQELGFEVRVVPWSELGRTGAVLRRTILVARTTPARMRWTVAHELGHIALEGRGTGDANEERLADRFAGALLIPRAIAGQAISAGIDLPELADRCRTSLAGTAHRLLDLLPSAVAVVERRRSTVARVSHLAPEAPAPVTIEVAEAALSLRAPQETTVDGWRVAAWTTPAESRAVCLAVPMV